MHVPAKSQHGPPRQDLPPDSDEWVEWETLLETGQGPWNGHDPMSSAVIENGTVRFYLDDATPAADEPRISVDAYRDMVKSLRGDMLGFLAAFETWLAKHGPPEVAHSLTSKVQQYLHLS